MKKLFISQPMQGKSKEEILAERKAAICQAKEAVGDEVEIIDSYFENAPACNRPLWFLGESLKLLATADIAYFATGWEGARGCHRRRDRRRADHAGADDAAARLPGCRGRVAQTETGTSGAAAAEDRRPEPMQPRMGSGADGRLRAALLLRKMRSTPQAGCTAAGCAAEGRHGVEVTV